MTVPVCLLTTAEYEVNLLSAGYLSDHATHGDDVEKGFSLHENGAIRPHRKRRANRLLGARRADCERNHFHLRSRFAQAQSFFDTILIHGVHHQLATLE